MEPARYMQALRRSWRLIAVFGIFGLVVGYAWSHTQAAQYRSAASVFFQVSGADNAGSLLQGSSFAQSQVRSYAVLATKPIVLEQVIDDLGLRTTSIALARQIDASIPLDTVIVDIQATAGDPDEARALADAVSRTLGETVETLSKSGSGPEATATVTAEQIGEASTPKGPISPNPRKDAVLGLLVGIILGMVVALTRELLNNRIPNEEALANVTDLPLLGKIPLVGPNRPQAQPFPVVNRMQVEAYRRAAANLDFINHGGLVRALVVTSANAAEGKSSLAANLAYVLAESRRVLLIEGDLRNPHLAERLGLEPAVGLTTILTGRAELDDVVQPAGEHLTVLTAGPIPPNPLTMLGSDAFLDLIAQARARYDLVIVDGAPLLPVTDSALLANILDGALLVVSSKKTTRAHLKRAIEHLRITGAPVHGVVMTMTRMAQEGYGYYGKAPEHHDTSAKTRRR